MPPTPSAGPRAGFSTAASSLLVFVPWAWFPSMRYELDDERLVLSCGPVRYAIRLAEVTRVSRRDLSLSLWGAMRVPGFAPGEVPYAGIGTVHMCSTRALRDIVLVETPRACYGLSPAGSGRSPRSGLRPEPARAYLPAARNSASTAARIWSSR
ncbi:MAG: PH domain-containing protein [Firmicutes bacterium]|nr:PH domain-containing protein [Bacillota bacterium]